MLFNKLGCAIQTCPYEAKTTPKKQGHTDKAFWWVQKNPNFYWFFGFFFLQYKSSCPLASDTPGKLDVLGHYSHPLCMDRTQIGILKKTHKVSLGCFLECKNSMALETKISLQTRNKRLRSSVSLKQMPSKRSRNILPFRFTQSGINFSMQRWNRLQACQKGRWKRVQTLKSWAISRTSLWNGSFRISNSVLFWYLRISLHNQRIQKQFSCKQHQTVQNCP